MRSQRTGNTSLKFRAIDMNLFKKYSRFSAGANVCIRQMVTGAGLFSPVLFFFLTACAQSDGFHTVASWYGKPDGKGGYEDCTTITAYGKRYDSSEMVCASWEFSPGTRLRVSLGSTRSRCRSSMNGFQE